MSARWQRQPFSEAIQSDPSVVARHRVGLSLRHGRFRTWQNSGVAPLAQSEEQWTFNPRVLGSKPRGGTATRFA